MLLTAASDAMARSQTEKLRRQLSFRPDQVNLIESQMQNLLEKGYTEAVPSDQIAQTKDVPV